MLESSSTIRTFLAIAHRPFLCCSLRYYTGFFPHKGEFFVKGGYRVST
ncbi:hypothetical protein HMPREF0239_05139 [Clostridium sp. ATCC BAA-442]|nr:hypothetical protein HMPREF0239_05139 [Clostridium sp. ATCC BAA-442]